VFTGWVNAAGHPAISVPIEPDKSGMPIGLQLVGDMGFDERVVGLALALERATAS
jgi:aspartyl-tRNA(Asn)/glutamyl-tRNA(Gln) amidotransferase subunit A